MLLRKIDIWSKLPSIDTSVDAAGTSACATILADLDEI